MKSKLWRIPHLLLWAGLLLVIFTLPALAQINPVPLINQPLVPDAVAPGGPAFTLTVNGTGFVSSSVVNWSGSARTTTFFSGSRLTAAITAADIATAGTASVTVVNPTPGGGASNVTFLSITNPTTSVTTSLASSPSTGYFPLSVAVGDFNGDGKLDLAVVNEESNTVSILLGDGTGNFTLASSPATGTYPRSVAVGDFNGDGKLDLAVANDYSGFGDGTVSILLGDGTGNFTLASSPAVGSEPTSLAVGDFNGDGELDLAVANYCGSGNCGTSDTVSILLGDGTGNFSLVSSPVTGNNPVSVAVGDFNGDGRLDLAVANYCANGNCSTGGTVSILLGDGTGNFTLASSTAVGFLPNSVAAGDFNGDEKLDLAVANLSSNTVSILLGDGMGNFTLASSPATGFHPDSVAMGDFNGDGRLDLAVVNHGSDTVSVLVQAPAVTVSPGNLSFGNQLVGTTSAPQSVTLTNSGSAPLTLAISVTGQNASDFSQTNTCGTIVFGGASVLSYK
jgi:hypothetical protein